ncbi:hypothetical protein M0804_010002 [Polistes exclamans]|nr:hypothetical protein M0804_010002 [Polistes exclamans]
MLVRDKEYESCDQRIPEIKVIVGVLVLYTKDYSSLTKYPKMSSLLSSTTRSFIENRSFLPTTSSSSSSSNKIDFFKANNKRREILKQHKHRLTAKLDTAANEQRELLRKIFPSVLLFLIES